MSEYADVDPPREFPVGTVVVLKSGSEPMTVSGPPNKEGLIPCCWFAKQASYGFYENRLSMHLFSSSMLESRDGMDDE